MTRVRLAAALCLASLGPGLAACAARSPAAADSTALRATAGPSRNLQADLDRIFDDPVLARALAAARVESLVDGRVLYARNAARLVIPASSLKLITVAVAAERLGWDHRFETRLESTGPIVDGVLRGDLVVVGGGDPSISAQDPIGAPLFRDWADALAAAGISRVDGRLIGDDSAFEDEPLGAGWAWDYLAAGYAAPSGALSYNENVVVLRISPGAAVGDPAHVQVGPPGHQLRVTSRVTTAPRDSTPRVTLDRLPGSADLAIGGAVPLGAATLVRTSTVDNPTLFFVEGLRLALAMHGIGVTGGAWDIDAIAPGLDNARAGRRIVARHLSPPLSSLAGYAMKVSQNFYGEMLLKAAGHGTGAATTGSIEAGRQVVRETLAAWNLPVETLVMYDGSGLSRYNYVSADLLVGVLRHVWRDERLRGPFVASLPVAGHDGTLGLRMRDSVLNRRVQAKTGTIFNVRSLAGYLETAAGEKLAFALIANNYIAPNAQIDAVMERALERLVR